jgi:hypothetical protein
MAVQRPARDIVAEHAPGRGVPCGPRRCRTRGARRGSARRREVLRDGGREGSALRADRRDGHARGSPLPSSPRRGHSAAHPWPSTPKSRTRRCAPSSPVTHSATCSPSAASRRGGELELRAARRGGRLHPHPLREARGPGGTAVFPRADAAPRGHGLACPEPVAGAGRGRRCAISRASRGDLHLPARCLAAAAGGRAHGAARRGAGPRCMRPARASSAERPNALGPAGWVAAAGALPPERRHGAGRTVRRARGASRGILPDWPRRGTCRRAHPRRPVPGQRLLPRRAGPARACPG